jgi:hypothetical protein
MSQETKSKTPRTDYASFLARVITPNFIGGTSHVVTSSFACQLETELNAAKAEIERSKREAAALATVIWQQEYANKAPQWGLCDSVPGIISQIDNMFAGVRNERDELRAKLAEAENERERLDWLESIPFGITKWNMADGSVSWSVQGDNFTFEMPTIRQAIDAARKGTR